MTQYMKVSLNQWLIVAASALFGFWGSYQALQWRVGEVEDKMDKFCVSVAIETKEEKEKVWKRFELDRLERQDNANMNRDMVNTLNLMQKDIDLILKKLP